MLSLALCTSLLFLPQYASSLLPLKSLPTQSPGLVLSSTGLFWIRLSKQMREDWMWAAAQPRHVGWPVTKRLLVPSAALQEQSGSAASARLVGGQHRITHWSALEQGTESKLLQGCFNANDPELLINEMHVYECGWINRTNWLFAQPHSPQLLLIWLARHICSLQW